MFYSGIADEAGQPIETQVRAHKELKWEHVEIRNVNKVNLTDLPDTEFDRVLGVVEKAGLRISCFASQIANWSRKITNPFEADMMELKRAIPRMKRAGTRFIRIMSYPNDSLSEPDWKREVIRRIRDLAHMAEDGGITLVHENCSGWGGESAANTLELLAEVNSSALKLVWDTGNPVGHKQNPLEYFRAVSKHVVYVHIKDGKLLPDGKSVEYTFPGEGDGQVRQTLKELLLNGYDGGFSIEPHMKAIVHLAKEASDEAAAYATYIEYGRRLEKLVASVRKT